MVNYLPLATTVVALAFFALLIRQYLWRRKIHQFLWTVAMLFYGISALMEFLMNPDLLGPSVPAFRVYYVLAAPLVGLLGAGVFYLLVRKRVAHCFFGFIVGLSAALAVAGFATPLDQAVITESFSGPLAEGFRAASHAYPMNVRIFAIILNSVGGGMLIGGAAFSLIRDRRRTYNIFFIIGGLLPAIGGSMIGFFGNPDVFFEFELGGTVFLFLGFLFSDRYLRKLQASGVPGTPTRMK